MPNDKERLDWLEANDGCGLISDDAGRWAVSGTGTQNMSDGDGPSDIVTNFFVEASEWKPSVREAIDAAMDDQFQAQDDEKEVITGRRPVTKSQ